jgi:hypothetical protein
LNLIFEEIRRFWNLQKLRCVKFELSGVIFTQPPDDFDFSQELGVVKGRKIGHFQQNQDKRIKMAEGMGFEPEDELPRLLISSCKREYTPLRRGR